MMFRIRFGNPVDWWKRLSFMDLVLGGHKTFFVVRPGSIQIRGFDIVNDVYAMLTYKLVPGFDVLHAKDEVIFSIFIGDIFGLPSLLRTVKKPDFLELSMEDSEHLTIWVGEGGQRKKQTVKVWRHEWKSRQEELEDQESILRGVDRHLTVTMEVHPRDFIEALETLGEISEIFAFRVEGKIPRSYTPGITFDVSGDRLLLVPPIASHIVPVRARIKPLRLERRGQLARATYDTKYLEYILETSRHAMEPTRLTIHFGRDAPLKTEMEFQNGSLTLYIAPYTRD